MNDSSKFVLNYGLKKSFQVAAMVTLNNLYYSINMGVFIERFIIAVLRQI